MVRSRARPPLATGQDGRRPPVDTNLALRAQIVRTRGSAWPSLRLRLATADRIEEGGDERLDLPRVERLGDEGHRAVTERLRRDLAVLGRRDHDDRYARFHVTDLLEEGEPAHAGHLQIEQDQVGPVPHDRVEARLPVGGSLDLQRVGAAHGPEDLGERTAHLGLVVHDQHAVRRLWPCFASRPLYPVPYLVTTS